MPNRKASPSSNSSRTAAKVAVAILVVIAVAGFVLAGLRSRTPDATQETVAPPTGDASSGSARAEEDAGGPNGVMFAPGSHRLSTGAVAKLQGLAETATKEHRGIAIQARFEMGTDTGERMALARKRTIAVRQVFEASGIPVAKLPIELSQVPAGVIPPAVVNRVEVVFR